MTVETSSAFLVPALDAAAAERPAERPAAAVRARFGLRLWSLAVLWVVICCASLGWGIYVMQAATDGNVIGVVSVVMMSVNTAMAVTAIFGAGRSVQKLDDLKELCQDLKKAIEALAGRVAELERSCPGIQVWRDRGQRNT